MTDGSSSPQFPTGFRWGAATAAYQIEGAAGEDGRGRSIWDTFAHTPGRVAGGDTGDVACDHYHRFRDDLKLMAELGIGAYRFSIAWPRIQPSGRGSVNQAGLDFYAELVDEMLGLGIEPWVTLYHWDLPQALQDAGGWVNRDTADRFADYVGAVYEALSDRVGHWVTLNEPWCSAFLGYGSGVHAPGATDSRLALRAAHHLLLGHGRAVASMRAANPHNDLGITLNLYPVTPASGSPADVEAARRIDGLGNRLFLDPVLRGAYPEDVLADVAPLIDDDLIHDGDLRVISAPTDFLGVNYYTRHVVAADQAEGRPADGAWPGCGDVRFVSRQLPTTAMGWEIDAPGLCEILIRVHQDYPGAPIYITENGAAFADVVTDSQVDDQPRLEFIDAHLRACQEAIAAGAPLGGYFVWSFLDNFEWALGYEKRFGIVHVDHETQERIPKASARWFGAVAQANALALTAEPGTGTGA